MNAVLLVIHMMVAAALVGTILLQRSEGGALGIGGGGGFMSGRSAGNALTKSTAVLAAMFFATSLALTLLASHTGPAKSVLTPTGGSQGDGGIPGLQLPLSPPAVPSGPPSAPAAPPTPPQ
ncbi:MAG: preprotein translocase subunit SecG [Methyloceanibacter sp.]|nr:preprotein translocase subunit SecG [Methyloceanibacter sp.]